MESTILYKTRIGSRNLYKLYAFTAVSRLWFDGGLWVIYFQHRGISLFDIGLLEALLHIVALSSDVPIGAFADRFGWKISLAAGTLLGVVYTVVALLSTSFWWIAVAFAARGLQVTLTSGSDSALTYESAVWARVADNYRAISGRMFAIGLISLGTAEAIGGALAKHSWAAIYIAFTVANVVAFLIVLWIKEPRQARLTTDSETIHKSVLIILQDAVRFAKQNHSFVKWITLSGTLSGFLATFAFYGQALLLNAGWTLIGIGVLMGIENGVGALAAVASDTIAKRFGERRTMVAVGTMASAGLMLFAWLPGPLAGIGYLLDSVAGNLAEPMIDQGLNKVIPTEQRATLLSANSTAFSLFMIVGFPLFGTLTKFIGLMAAAQISSIVAVVCILAVLWWWSRNKQHG